MRREKGHRQSASALTVLVSFFFRAAKGKNLCPDSFRSLFGERKEWFQKSVFGGVGKVVETGERRQRGLFYEFVDGLAEVCDGILIVMLNGVDNAVLDMILQNDFADVVDR